MKARTLSARTSVHLCSCVTVAIRPLSTVSCRFRRRGNLLNWKTERQRRLELLQHLLRDPVWQRDSARERHELLLTPQAQDSVRYRDISSVSSAMLLLNVNVGLGHVSEEERGEALCWTVDAVWGLGKAACADNAGKECRLHVPNEERRKRLVNETEITCSREKDLLGGACTQPYLMQTRFWLRKTCWVLVWSLAARTNTSHTITPTQT